MLSALKLDGHAVRVVYNSGYLVKATSRGRFTLGRDLTRHMKVILGEYNENFAHLGLVEIRGEVVLSVNNLHKAREFNPSIKSAFTGVSSLIRPYATDEEIALLDFVAYRFLSDATEGSSRSMEYEILEYYGFKTPEAILVNYDNTYDLDYFCNEVLKMMEDLVKDYEYHTDGVVLEINSYEDFINAESIRSVASGGNIALKMGYWQQKVYSSVIESVELQKGKGNRVAGFGSSKIPVAIIQPVTTTSGQTVRRVPLFNLATMYYLQAYAGEIIYFKYGGESGVIPCEPDGSVLKSALNTSDDSSDEYSDFEEELADFG